ncbi:hypothetical protein ACQF36_44290 [Streptomyces sp. Marseille-Q5077]|uniref:hypothetical protein n=1 Tax=Streptomyces sp. Marseille-Q5077 TaxID=3418995 RepID=UPI003CFCC184
MHRTTIAAVLAAGLLLTACTGSDSDKAAKLSPSASMAITPTAEEPATPAEDTATDALKEAEEDFEKSLDDLENALGETLGVQEGTYEVTNSEPEYDDPSLAFDHEFITPGTCTTKGTADQASSCYWARMRDASPNPVPSSPTTSLRDGRSLSWQTGSSSRRLAVSRGRALKTEPLT